MGFQRTANVNVQCSSLDEFESSDFCRLTK